jgi:hypothetical protein
VVQPTSGTYQMFSFGNLTKNGSYLGGSYISGGVWDQQLDNSYNSESSYCRGLFDGQPQSPNGWQVNFKNHSKHWYASQQFDTALTVTVDPINGVGYGGYRRGPTFQQFRNSPNASNSLSMLIALPFYAKVEGGLYVPLGHPTDVRGISMQNYSPQDEFSIGSDVWKVFPMASKGLVSVQGTRGVSPISSGNYGYAFKKIL